MDEQRTYFVQCPHDGKFVEVLAPAEKVVAVGATKGFEQFAADISGYKRTWYTSSCPDCHKPIWLYWSLQLR